MGASSMKKCGYSLTVEYLAEVTGAREDKNSNTGFMFSSDTLARQYESMGLTIKRSRGDAGPVTSGKCQICEEWNMRNCPAGTRAFYCDKALHHEFYDAFERGKPNARK